MTDTTAHETLFVTDAELIRRMGVPEKIARRTLKELDADPNKCFPPKLPMWGNRRYWPAIQKWTQGQPLPPARREDQDEVIGKVYFLASATHIKIGFSTKSRERLRDIRQYHYEPLELLALILDAPRRVETALHKRFAAHRVPRKREWFHRVPEIEEFAEAHHLKPWREDLLP